MWSGDIIKNYEWIWTWTEQIQWSSVNLVRVETAVTEKKYVSKSQIRGILDRSLMACSETGIAHCGAMIHYILSYLFHLCLMIFLLGSCLFLQKATEYGVQERES
jgi:hypothetical protein